MPWPPFITGATSTTKSNITRTTDVTFSCQHGDVRGPWPRPWRQKPGRTPRMDRLRGRRPHSSQGVHGVQLSAALGPSVDVSPNSRRHCAAQLGSDELALHYVIHHFRAESSHPFFRRYLFSGPGVRLPSLQCHQHHGEHPRPSQFSTYDQ